MLHALTVVQASVLIHITTHFVRLAIFYKLLFLAPYVKVYLLFGKKCIAKKKTKTARKTLDPLYSQQLEFPQNYRGKILQVGSFH